MGFLGSRRGVLRVSLGWRRGTDGRFYRGIPGFWPGRGRGAAIQRTADADRVVGQKNFLKRGEKLRKTRKIGVREVPEGGLGTP